MVINADGITLRTTTCGVIGGTCFVDDAGGIEQEVNGRGTGRAGRSGVVHQALQFLGVGKSPVAIAQVVDGVLLLNPGQGFLPVQAGQTVLLCPHQACGLVSDGVVVIHTGECGYRAE